MTVLDLFAGPGGWDVGARDLDLCDVLGVELDEYACATREAAGLATMHADVSRLDPGARAFRDACGLIASPPCQTFSMAGNGRGRRALELVLDAVPVVAAGGWPSALDEDPRTALVLQPLSWAVQLEPGWIAWEQVPTVLPVWRACAEQLRRLGYSVWTGNLNAEQFGVPQTRRRAFLLARYGEPVAPPIPTHSRYHVREPARLDPCVRPWVTMAEALGEVETYTVDIGRRDKRQRSGDEPSRTLTAQAISWTLRMTGNTKATTRDLDQPAQTIAFGHDAGRSGWVLRNNNQAKACTCPLDAPAGTLFFGGRVNTVEWQSGSFVRQITPEEAAALQGFPPGYPFRGSKTNRFQQVGNAVPPPLARAVLAAVAG